MILIDSWPYDLMVSGELQLESEITERAVESGGDVADHIRPKPVQFTLEVIVSDTPLAELEAHESRRVDDVSAAVFGSDQIPLPSDEAYARLLAIRDESRLVTVEIPIATRSGKPGKRTFTNMAIASLTIPFNADTVGGLHFSVTFQQVKIVTNRRTTVKVAVKSPTGAPKDHGLSLDNIVEGDAILWRKGDPPGRSPATDPPGKIIGTEVVYSVKGKVVHSDKKTPLSTAELEAFTKDLDRDTALMSRRKLARIDERIDKIGDKLDRAQKLLDAKEANPGKYIDPALFGL